MASTAKLVDHRLQIMYRLLNNLLLNKKHTIFLFYYNLFKISFVFLLSKNLAPAIASISIFNSQSSNLNFLKNVTS